MATTIGAVACDLVRGDPKPQAQRLAVWYTPGIGSPGAHALGLGDGAFHVVAVEFAAAANLVTWHANLCALQGSVVSITNDWGTTYANCLITRVGPMVRTTANTTSGRAEVHVEGVRSA